MELIFESNLRTNWKWFVELLEHCPKLQNLTIDQVLLILMMIFFNSSFNYILDISFLILVCGF